MISSLDHSILKGLLVGAGSLAIKYSGRYPSLTLITASLYGLEQAFSKEVKMASALDDYERRGYNVSDFRTRLQNTKAENLEGEFKELVRNIEDAERLRTQLYRVPPEIRTNIERRLMVPTPENLREVQRVLV